MLKQVALILMLVCCAQAQADIYKWKDATGRTHYSALPPASGSYENLAKPPAPSEDPQAAMEALRSKVEAIDEDREELERQQQAAQVAKTEQERRAENCKRAQTNLEALDSDKDVIQTDADGNKVVLSRQQRQQALNQARKDVSYYCN